MSKQEGGKRARERERGGGGSHPSFTFKHSFDNLLLWKKKKKKKASGREGGGRRASLTRKYVCWRARTVCVCTPVKRGWGPRLLMYLHIMLGSDPAAVSKMFEAQNTISEKCSHRLAILFLQRPDTWPLSCSPAHTYTPSSHSVHGGEVGGGGY